jgi:hypothetical protein
MIGNQVATRSGLVRPILYLRYQYTISNLTVRVEDLDPDPARGHPTLRSINNTKKHFTYNKLVR